jgi:hypothetical protein
VCSANAVPGNTDIIPAPLTPFKNDRLFNASIVIYQSSLSGLSKQVANHDIKCSVA